MNVWPSWKEQKLFYILLVLLMVAVIGMATTLAVGFGISTLQQEPAANRNVITVDGRAQVDVAPNRATISLGVETTADTVEAAQNQNSTTTNELIAAIKNIGIPDADIQTRNYTVREDERWNPETQDYISRGWIVSQQVQVTLREDVSRVAQVVTVAGQHGVTNIYGPNFTVENRDQYVEQARKDAIQDARAKADAIAESLGLEVVEVVEYRESTGGSVTPLAAREDAVGIGGAAPEPTIEPGTQEVQISVSITYRLK